MKIYGNEKTALHLTPKAEWAYSKTDPLRIIERADGTYSLRGAENRDNMTAQDVIDWLEELAKSILDALAGNICGEIKFEVAAKEVGGSQAALSFAALSFADLLRESFGGTGSATKFQALSFADLLRESLSSTILSLADQSRANQEAKAGLKP